MQHFGAKSLRQKPTQTDEIATYTPLAPNHFRFFLNEQEIILACYMLEPLLDIPSQIDFLSIGKKIEKKGFEKCLFHKKKSQKLYAPAGDWTSASQVTDG